MPTGSGAGGAGFGGGVKMGFGGAGGGVATAAVGGATAGAATGIGAEGGGVASAGVRAVSGVAGSAIGRTMVPSRMFANSFSRRSMRCEARRQRLINQPMQAPKKAAVNETRSPSAAAQSQKLTMAETKIQMNVMVLSDHPRIQYTDGAPGGRVLKRLCTHKYCDGASRTMRSMSVLMRAVSATASSVGKFSSGASRRSA
jgi:hypothetical protein